MRALEAKKKLKNLNLCFGVSAIICTFSRGFHSLLQAPGDEIAVFDYQCY